MNLTKSQLQFFFNEVLEKFGWCEEIEETTVDPLGYVLDEVNNTKRHVENIEKQNKEIRLILLDQSRVIEQFQKLLGVATVTSAFSKLAVIMREESELRRHIKRLEKSIELRDAASKTGSIYCWFFENVTSVIERDYEAQEFAREIILEVRRTYEKLEAAEQGVQPTVLTARHKLVTCPRCLCVHGIDLPAQHSR